MVAYKFIDHLLFVSYSNKALEYNTEQNQQDPCPREACNSGGVIH